MRIPIAIQVLTASAALAALGGCFGNPAIAPKPFRPLSTTHSLTSRVPISLNVLGMLKASLNSARRFTSFDACPAKGDIEYISDYTFGVVNIYRGKFAGQAPCGQITGLSFPEGMFIKGSTHDLYVSDDVDIKAFHRGATTPFATYTDPTQQAPVDVTVAKDGTVIAANVIGRTAPFTGSISTWLPNGTFVGNFPMPNVKYGLYVTVQKDGTLYFSDVDATSGAGLLWTGRCPHGACGAFTSTGATTVFPGGLRSADSEDVVQVDQGTMNADSSLITYEGFPTGTSCQIVGAGDVVGIDFKVRQHHMIYADPVNNVGGEIDYPSCAITGTVPGNANGMVSGAAADAPEPL